MFKKVLLSLLATAASISIAEAQPINPSATQAWVNANFLPITGGTLTGDLKFTDATYDIGKAGATRPRDLFYSRTGQGGTLALGGATIGTNALAVTGTTLLSGATTMSAALTYGGVTLANSVQGTGSMVLSSGPTLTTPALGVATATSVAINGATIGSHGLAVTGTSSLSGVVTFGDVLSSAGAITINGASGGALQNNGTSMVGWNGAALFPSTTLGAALGTTTNEFPNVFSRLHTLSPGTAPSAPSTSGAWTLYVDSGDGNKLKAIASNSTIVVLGTP